MWRNTALAIALNGQNNLGIRPQQSARCQCSAMLTAS